MREVDVDRPDGLIARIKAFRFARHAQRQIQQAGMSWSATHMLAAMGLLCIPGLGLGAAVGLLFNRFLTAIVLAVLAASLPYLYVRKRRKKRLDTLEEQFPEALDFLSRSMRAGHAFTISFQMVGEELADPLGQEFRTLFNEQNLGATLEAALRNFSERVPLLDVRFFTSSVLLQKQTGGNLAEILTRLAYVIRERFRLKGQVKAASAHGRLTATILTEVFRTLIQFILRGASGARTRDRRIMRSTTLCTARPSCTFDTGHRTDDAHCTSQITRLCHPALTGVTGSKNPSHDNHHNQREVFPYRLTVVRRGSLTVALLPGFPLLKCSEQKNALAYWRRKRGGEGVP